MANERQAKTNWVRDAAALCARGVALFFGAFGLANLTVGRFAAGFDVNAWWMDLRFLPAWAAQPILAAGAGALAGYALWPRLSRRLWLQAPVALLTLFSLGGAWRFWLMVGRGEVRSAFPAPAPALIAAAMGWVLWTMRRGPATGVSRPKRRWATALAAGAVAAAFPLALMWTFGKTDFRRPADAAVVLGAGVYADGTPSLALCDRMRTGVALYHAGLAPRLILSGGPGGAVHETEAMRRLAIRGGVPADRLILDAGGWNTRATVAHTAPLFRKRGFRRVLAVSHFYHLPRIKMAFWRAGVEVDTVPAQETRALLNLPYFMAREIAAFWCYYLRIK